MDLAQFIFENKDFLKIIYGLIVGLICMIIFLKTDKFFKLSSHEGIRYFRNAFFFYGLAFLIRYFFGVFFDTPLGNIIIWAIFEYFVILAGFFLLYSLIWKKFNHLNEYSSLFNPKVIVFHLMAIIITLLDALFGSYNLMFLSQIIIFFYASLISYSNYRKNSKRKFLKFYSVAMILELFAWTFNFIAAKVFLWNREFWFVVGFINIIFFLLILYGIIRTIKIK